VKRLALAAVLLLLVVAGCGEREETLGPAGSRHLELMLDWVPNADHAGIYTAAKRGFFKQNDLDVQIRTPGDPTTPLKLVAAGRVDLAISYEPEVLRARDQGVKVVAVGALIPQPLTSVLSLPPDPIKSAADLRGKTVGTAGIDYQDAFLDAMARKAGFDPSQIKHKNVGFDLNPALLTHKVDATLGGFVNVEQVQLEQAGKNPTGFTVDKGGIPPYDELVLVTSESTLAKKRDEIRSFIGALGRGTSVAERNPDAAAGYLIDAEPRLKREAKLVEAGVAKTPFEQPAGKPFGYQDPAQWKAFAQFMRESGILRGVPDVSKALTNDLLPGD
jgi:putative hydroxymethylpyrimidine transport system substrate-binding protein